MRQIVYKHQPGKRARSLRYGFGYAHASPKCSLCKRTLKVGECIIKLTDWHKGMHRSCVEDWLAKHPAGAPAAAVMTKEFQAKEFERIRRQLQSDLRSP